MNRLILVVVVLGLVGCGESKPCSAVGYVAPAVQVSLDSTVTATGGGQGGAGGAGSGCTTKLKVTDLDAQKTYEGCDTVDVGEEPGRYRLRIEYGELAEERTVEVSERTERCYSVADTVKVTAFEK